MGLKMKDEKYLEEEELYKKVMGKTPTTTTPTTLPTTPKTTTPTTATPYDETARQQLSDNDVVLERIKKYLPQTLKASGLTGVGYNEKSLLNSLGNVVSQRKDILSENAQRQEKRNAADKELELQYQESQRKMEDSQIETLVSDIESGVYSVTQLEDFYKTILGENEGDDATTRYINSLNDYNKSSLQTAIEHYYTKNKDNIDINEKIDSSISSFVKEDGTPISASLKRGSIKEKEGDDFFLTLNGENFRLEVGDEKIDKGSEVGERLLEVISKQKNGASAKEGDVIYYSGNLYVVSKDGNLVSIRARNKIRQNDFNALLDYYKNATTK